MVARAKRAAVGTSLDAGRTVEVAVEVPAWILMVIGMELVAVALIAHFKRN